MTVAGPALTHSDWIAIIGIFVSAIIAVLLYVLGKKLDDKQKIDHVIEMQDAVGKLLGDGPQDIELYNAKLYDKRNFEKNTRSLKWGYAYHGAGLYNYGFENVEFVVEHVCWRKKNFYKVGLIPYKKILKIRSEGDGSTGKPILFVRPRLIQLDKYSMSYTKFIYYPRSGGAKVRPPLDYYLIRFAKKIFLRVRYYLWYRWKKR